VIVYDVGGRKATIDLKNGSGSFTAGTAAAVSLSAGTGEHCADDQSTHASSRHPGHEWAHRCHMEEICAQGMLTSIAIAVT
jgi:hypothetical protein